MKELFYMLEESTPLSFQNDPEYRRLSEEEDRIWDQIAASLGPNGNARFNEPSNARAEAERFWRFAVLRRTLALGVALGALTGEL